MQLRIHKILLVLAIVSAAVVEVDSIASFKRSFIGDVSYAKDLGFATDDSNTRSTVRISGSTQGSGVIVGRYGNNYHLLTAWHVIAANHDGEEVDIGNGVNTFSRIVVARGKNVKRIGNLDLALVTFTSKENLFVAKLAETLALSPRDGLVVIGYPLDKNNRAHVSNGAVVAFADFGIDQGYKLLYTNQTQPGMSGGPIYDSYGRVIGIHGRGERDIVAARERPETVVKTGVNQGIPIDYYVEYKRTGSIRKEPSNPVSFDDYYALSIHANNIQQPQSALRAAKMMQRIRPKRFEAYVIEQILQEKLSDSKSLQVARQKGKELFSHYLSLINQGMDIYIKNPRDALRLASEALEIYRGDFIDIAHLKSLAYTQLNDYEQALKYGLESIDILDSGRDTASLIFKRDAYGFIRESLYFTIANAYMRKQDWNNAYQAFTLSIQHSGPRSRLGPLLYMRAEAAVRSDSIRLNQVCGDMYKWYELSSRKTVYGKGSFMTKVLCSNFPDARSRQHELAEAYCKLSKDPRKGKYAYRGFALVFADEYNISPVLADDLRDSVRSIAMNTYCPDLFD